MAYPEPFANVYDELTTSLSKATFILLHKSWAQGGYELKLSETQWLELTGRRTRIAQRAENLIVEAARLLSKISPEEERALFPGLSRD